MNTESDLKPLSQLGQALRQEGLTLDAEEVRKAARSGTIPAVRDRKQWYVTIETARRFATPLTACAVT